MTKHEKELQALRGEIAGLREQLSTLAVEMVKLAAHQPVVQYAPYWVAPYVAPAPPIITWSCDASDNQCSPTGLLT